MVLSMPKIRIFFLLLLPLLSSSLLLSGEAKKAHEITRNKGTSHHGMSNLPSKKSDNDNDYDSNYSSEEDEEEDVCLSWICPPGQSCKPSQGERGSFPPPFPTCTCTESCLPTGKLAKQKDLMDSQEDPDYKDGEEDEDPVCGSDGNLYPSECELHRTACLTGDRNLHIVSIGDKKSCEKEETGDQSDHDIFPGNPGEVGGGGFTFQADEMEDDDDDSKSIKPKNKRGSNLCTREEYEIFKEALLIYNREHISKSNGKGRGSLYLDLEGRKDEDDLNPDELLDQPVEREELMSLIFGHFDHNHDGQLDYGELQRIGLEERLGRLLQRCHPVDFLRFDDANLDSLSPKEFQEAFNNLYGSRVVQPPIIRLKGKVGESLSLECPHSSSKISSEWSRYDQPLLDRGKADGIRIESSAGGDTESLRIPKVQLNHAGNYSCKWKELGREEQQFVVTVIREPKVSVQPRMRLEHPGTDVTFECRAQGEPIPTITWMKNDVLISHSNGKDKYVLDGPFLTVKDVGVSDTGAYFCEAANEAGKASEFSTLLVLQDVSAPIAQQIQKPENETYFVILHAAGIGVYDPTNCRLERQIGANDIIPGTRSDLVCGNSCNWGEGIVVATSYIYATQPSLSRVLVISISEMVVVDVISTNELLHPFHLDYVPHLDQVWIRSKHSGVMQVVLHAKVKRKHEAFTLEEDRKFGIERVKSAFLPKEEQFSYGYVTTEGVLGMYKLDLRTLKYTKSVDLTKYNCQPERVHFVALFGFVVLDCREPVMGKTTGQLVLDYLTDAVLFHNPLIQGPSFLSPDNRAIITMRPHATKTTNTKKYLDRTEIVVQLVKQSGLQSHFFIKSHINATDAAFFPSQHTHGSFDLFVAGIHESNVLVVDLQNGRTDVVPGVGRAPLSNQRRISAELTTFTKYLVSPGRENVFVINGRSRTVNCRVGKGHLRSISSSILWLNMQKPTNGTDWTY